MRYEDEISDRFNATKEDVEEASRAWTEGVMKRVPWRKELELRRKFKDVQERYLLKESE